MICKKQTNPTTFNSFRKTHFHNFSIDYAGNLFFNQAFIFFQDEKAFFVIGALLVVLIRCYMVHNKIQFSLFYFAHLSTESTKG